MSVITLTSDFGYRDYRVSALKGSIISLHSEASIVDITHNINAHDLKETAYIVKNAYHYFPTNSIHIICVDSLYHKERKYLIYKINEHYFLSADNGIISLVFSEINADAIYEITYNTRFDDVVNFAPADILVPAAVHLLKGGIPEVIGRKFTEPKTLTFPNAGFSDNMIFGEVLYIDSYGNIVTNINKSQFEEIARLFNNFTIRFRSLALGKIYNSHTGLIANWENEHEYHGKSVAVFNESNLLEISIYKGNIKNGAHTLFGLHIGERVYIEFHND